MSLLLLKLGKFLLGKVVGIVVLVVLAVGCFAAYLYVTDSIRLEQERLEKLASLRSEASEAYERLGDLHEDLVDIAKRIEVSQTRLKLAKETLDYLESVLLKIEYFFYSAKEKQVHDEKLKSAKSEREQITGALSSLITDQGGLKNERAELVEKTKQFEERITELETSGSEAGRYLSSSWEQLKVYLPISLAILLLGPIALKAFVYYAIAPLVAAAKPIRFAEGSKGDPAIGQSGVSASIKLRDGERIWVREAFLQASDESLSKRTRFLLDWRFPVTCIAAGLVELTELSVDGEENEGSLTVSTQDKPDLEIAVVDLKEGESMIIRPSFVAALAGEMGERVDIRRRWRFGAAQSWITLQFRYFEFIGPCRIGLAGTRGVRVEVIENPKGKGRRANQDSTIGFTPSLSYGAARAETFWAYFRGFNPLFDDVFSGEGIFLCQEISKGSEAMHARRFWGGLKEGFLKILGV